MKCLHENHPTQEKEKSEKIKEKKKKKLEQEQNTRGPARSPMFLNPVTTHKPNVKHTDAKKQPTPGVLAAVVLLCLAAVGWGRGRGSAPSISC